MSYDPGQQPSGPTQSPNPVSQPSGPYDQIPGQPLFAPPPFLPEPRKKSRRWLWITLIVIVLLIAGAAATTVILTAPTRAITATVQQYYNAVQQQDYATAYTYLDRQSFIYLGQQRTLSRTDYTLASRANDLAEGKVTTYAITNIEITSSNNPGGIAIATVDVTRKGIVREISVQLAQVNGNWEIDKISQA